MEAAVQVAAVFVLLEEGVEVGEHGHARDAASGGGVRQRLRFVTLEESVTLKESVPCRDAPIGDNCCVAERNTASVVDRRRVVRRQ